MIPYCHPDELKMMILVFLCIYIMFLYQPTVVGLPNNKMNVLLHYWEFIQKSEKKNFSKICLKYFCLIFNDDHQISFRYCTLFSGLIVLHYLLDTCNNWVDKHKIFQHNINTQWQIKQMQKSKICMYIQKMTFCTTDHNKYMYQPEVFFVITLIAEFIQYQRSCAIQK